MKLKDLPDSLDTGPGRMHAEPVIDDRPVDTETPRAMALQLQWLALPSVKARRESLGWDAAIHHTSRVTYRDVRDTPHYGWHQWMMEQIISEPVPRIDSGMVPLFIRT